MIAAACSEPRAAVLEPRVAPLVWGGAQELMASDAAELDEFGCSVSLAGDRALVGAYGESDARGAAYVFARSGDAWTEEQKLVASDGAELDKLGTSVSIGGDQCPRRGVRSERLSRRRLRLRQERQRLDRGTEARRRATGPLATTSATSVSLAGDRALVGAYGSDTGRGAAYVFVQEWQRLDRGAEARRERRGRGDSFGCVRRRSPAIARLVGAPGNDGYRGAAYVFVGTAARSAWTEEQKLVASDGAAFDDFGNAVSLAGDRALVGAYWNDDFRGAAYVYRPERQRDGAPGPRSRSSSRATGPTADRFGNAVSLRPATAPSSGRARSGAAYVFARTRQLLEPRSRGSSRAARHRWTCSAGPSRSPPIAPWSGPATLTSFAARPTSTRSASRPATRAPMPTAGRTPVRSTLATPEPGSCIRGDECASGHCEDGICCDRTCAASERCRAELKVSGEDGVCGPAKAAATGAPCRFDVQCTSGHCSGADGVCGDADAAPDAGCTSGDACVSGRRSAAFRATIGGCGCRAGRARRRAARAPGLGWLSRCCSCGRRAAPVSPPPSCSTSACRVTPHCPSPTLDAGSQALRRAEGDVASRSLLMSRRRRARRFVADGNGSAGRAAAAGPRVVAAEAAGEPAAGAWRPTTRCCRRACAA